MNQTQQENHFDKCQRIDRCRACNSSHLVSVIDLGTQPNANSLLSSQSEQTPVFPLEMCFCERCKAFQQRYTVDKEYLFKNYVYFSSTSPVFEKHFEDLAWQILAEYDPKLIVDIGSNDGIFLKNFSDSVSIRAIGIEPAENVVLEALRSGYKTELGWIEDREFVDFFIQKYGQANVIVACNVFAHVDNIRGFLKNVKRMLKDDGVFIIEVAHLLKFIQNNYFDTIYHEHFFIHSVIALSNLFHYNNMKIIRAEEIDTHGGSIRLYVTKRSHKSSVGHTVKDIIKEELHAGLQYASTFMEVENKLKKSEYALKDKMSDLRDQKKVLCAYGAPAKANTLLNTFRLDDVDIACIADDSPAKQGKFMPMSQIPIVDTDTMLNQYKPDCILILAWNFAPSIIEKLKSKGYTGQFLLPFAETQVSEDNNEQHS